MYCLPSILLVNLAVPFSRGLPQFLSSSLFGSSYVFTWTSNSEDFVINLDEYEEELDTLFEISNSGKKSKEDKMDTIAEELEN